MNQARNAFLHPFAKPTKDNFIKLVRGKGALVWDNNGNELVDGMASLWYCAVGHGRKEIADAVAKQIETLEAYSTFDPFTSEPVEQLAAKLVSLCPMPDARVFFCGSGSEAVDSAMKLARLAHVQAGRPERTLIISRMRGYHGTNYGGTSAQGLPLNKVGYGPLVLDVEQVASDDLEALSVLMTQRGNTVAAILAEPLQGAGGVYPPSADYLKGLRKLCDQHGAFLIFDEVITGFARLGTWFGANFYDVNPDLLCFAKAVTSGYQRLLANESVMRCRHWLATASSTMRAVMALSGPLVCMHHKAISKFATACSNSVRSHVRSTQTQTLFARHSSSPTRNSTNFSTPSPKPPPENS
ncbi:MAG: aspartate aminotransferase family protein [Actinobacteria bacterium]|nr:aspartate aminotransferase family protein [Actinomycetota bacterium]